MMILSATASLQKSAVVSIALVVYSTSAACFAQETKAPTAVQPAKKGLRLPAWAAKANWQSIAMPFQEALEKGGNLMLQLPKSLQRQIALARNNNQAVVVQRALVLRAGRANGNQQMEQQIKQLIPQYRNQYIHILYGELQAVRTYCEIPAESRAEVYNSAEEAYEKALEQFVRGMYMPTERGQQGAAMRSAVRGSLVALLEKKLPPGEFTRLDRSINERSELRKRICVDSVLARMDEVMRLAPQQREKISESIRSNWSDDWESWLMLWQYEDNYLPQVEDSLIVTHLTPQQRRIWQQAQKISLRGEMHSEFAGEFDATYWNVKPKKAEPEVIDRLER